ncbi:hypothetical protein [Nostoc sp. CCY0012]|uniref:hypothetical protein n=1 Tax=Nostoc sp. CCY0012 TaxID=1056123 RepID=UPI0039C64222
MGRSFPAKISKVEVWRSDSASLTKSVCPLRATIALIANGRIVAAKNAAPPPVSVPKKIADIEMVGYGALP